jgi:hypothetical protein
MAYGDTNLLDAIRSALLTDSVLVDLLKEGSDTERQEAETRIAEWYPKSHGRYPFVGIQIIASGPLGENNGVTRMRDSLVGFHCISCDQLKTSMIADRIIDLLTIIPPGEETRWFYDVSDNFIRNVSTEYRFRTIIAPMLEQDTDSFRILVQAAFVWSDKVCGEEAEFEVDAECPYLVDDYYGFFCYPNEV